MIKVEGTRSAENLRSVRGRTVSASSSGFALPAADEARNATSVSAPARVGGLDALVALQEVSDALTGRAKAAKRGRDMLDLLDDMRVGMLTGTLDRATLRRLTALSVQPREDFSDPQLSGVLDEIDLRVQVELAKVNFASAK